jgi:polyribonucleotide 5'-hydroxyl-kinase
MATTTAAAPAEEIVLARECEYRVEISAQAEITVKLVSGSAELFGVELAIDREYTLRDQKAAIFSWYGATLQVRGTPEVAYTSDETPMNSYVNIHAQLQKRRELAKLKHSAGPRVLVAGPVDSGKSTLTQILLNYALRLGEKPTHVDLDVGQNSLSVPGAVAASPLDMNCLSVEDGYVLTNPLVHFFGHTSMADNADHFRHVLRQLARAVKRRLEDDADVNASGCVINTCGWVDGLGFDLLVESIQAFDVDVVLVIGQDRLYSRLQSSLASNPNLSIVKVLRSGGVVPLNSKVRAARRQSRIRDYFYGAHALLRPVPLLSPCVNEYDMDELTFYAVKDMTVSAGMLPVGQTASDLSRLFVTKLDKTLDQQHTVAAVAHPKKRDAHENASSADMAWLLEAPAAGFVVMYGFSPSSLSHCIYTDTNTVMTPHSKEIREADKKIVLLVPSPGPLPSKHLVLGSIKWIE